MLKRRQILGAAVAASVAGAIPGQILAAEEPLRVSGYGGFFETAYRDTICAKFTEETGIAVETVSQGQGDDWLFGLVRAVRGGLAPVDVTILQEVALIRLMNMGNILQALDIGMMPNIAGLPAAYNFQHQGDYFGIGVMSWYQTLVINPESVREPPASWRTIFEDEEYRQRIALIGIYNGGIPEIVARTYFDGNETFLTREGIDAVFAKTAELKRQVKFWWSAESQMEQALRNKDVIAGTYYHDVANLLQEEGFPIASIFPKEGGFIGVGRLAVPVTSKKRNAAHAFINFCARPDNQALFARGMRLSPVIPQSQTDLTDKEFKLVGSNVPPIRPAAQVMVKQANLLQRKWQRMITA